MVPIDQTTSLLEVSNVGRVLLVPLTSPVKLTPSSSSALTITSPTSVPAFDKLQWIVYSVGCPTLGGNGPSLRIPESASLKYALALILMSPDTLTSEFAKFEVRSVFVPWIIVGDSMLPFTFNVKSLSLTLFIGKVGFTLIAMVNDPSSPLPSSLNSTNLLELQVTVLEIPSNVPAVSIDPKSNMSPTSWAFNKASLSSTSVLFL